jgi:hypothetical protein
MILLRKHFSLAICRFVGVLLCGAGEQPLSRSPAIVTLSRRYEMKCSAIRSLLDG